MRLSVYTPCGPRAANFSVSEVKPEISANNAAAIKFSVVGWFGKVGDSAMRAITMEGMYGNNPLLVLAILIL